MRYFLFNIENLVLRARQEFNGFAGIDANRFGVLEYWSDSIADFGMRIAEFEISSLFNCH